MTYTLLSKYHPKEALLRSVYLHFFQKHCDWQHPPSLFFLCVFTFRQTKSVPLNFYLNVILNLICHCYTHPALPPTFLFSFLSVFRIFTQKSSTSHYRYCSSSPVNPTHASQPPTEPTPAAPPPIITHDEQAASTNLSLKSQWTPSSPPISFCWMD